MAPGNKEIPTFRLAITMAGAGSAGCFTGGVMDYLFEILDLWEKARQENSKILQHHRHLIPPHRVIIDAMGGASAGGMTTTMSAIYALNGIINPVKTPAPPDQVKQPKQNIFYDSWVLMDDDNPSDPRPLFQKIWDTDDLHDGRVGSLLNSSFIDTIADKAFQYSGKERNDAHPEIRPASESNEIKTKAGSLPAYISKNLELLYSHCLLRGIPLEVNFETEIAKKGRKSVVPNHATFEHYFVSHYHLNQGEKPDTNKYLWLNPYEKPFAEAMELSTKATGAFPAGLLYREFTQEHFSDKYLRTVMKRIITGRFGDADPDPDEEIVLRYFPKNFSSFSVDGGAINNEPYREVLSILKDKYGDTPKDGYHRYGVIMIDPFPDRAQTTGPYDQPNDLLDVIQGILGTLTDQSRIKRREILEADASKYYRSIIFPRKWILKENGEAKLPEPVPIACASGMAFGGFLDIKFREHDFFLGRNNARNFFRYYFSFPYNDGSQNPAERIVHPIHEHWTPEMIETFRIEKDGKTFLPIIPDLNILLEKEAGIKIGRYEYDIPKIPRFDPSILFQTRTQMQHRFSRIIQLLKQRDFSEAKALARKKERDKLPEKQRIRLERKDVKEQRQLQRAATWMAHYYPDQWYSPFLNLLLRPVRALSFLIAKRMLARMATKKAIQAILNDLAKKDLLKQPE